MVNAMGAIAILGFIVWAPIFIMMGLLILNLRNQAIYSCYLLEHQLLGSGKNSFRG
jgi:hypothetical protein